MAWPRTPWNALGMVTGQSQFPWMARRMVRGKRGRRQHRPTWTLGISLWLTSEERMGAGKEGAKGTNRRLFLTSEELPQWPRQGRGRERESRSHEIAFHVPALVKSKVRESGSCLGSWPCSESSCTNCAPSLRKAAPSPAPLRARGAHSSVLGLFRHQSVTQGTRALSLRLSGFRSVWLHVYTLGTDN